MLSGYAGKIAWVDLTEKSVRIQELDESLARKYLGGKGLGAYLFITHQKVDTDPLGPDNILIFVTGPLTGTNFPAASRSGVITKSPLTGTFLDAYSGGFFGTQLKWSGFDAIAIRGKSKAPCYLMAEDGEIRIRKADHLWGLTTSETELELRRALSGVNKARMSIAAIGPAGENLVRFASIINEKRAHGRGGAGAVMGSKNLKALIVRGDQKPKIATDTGFKKIVKRCYRQIASHPLVRKGGPFSKYGTTMTIDLTQETGTLPTRNWQENTFEGEANIGGDSLMAYVSRSRACFGCPIGCSRDSSASINGEAYETEGPDYETLFAFGSNCGISDPAVIIAADRFCDDYGMDTISCGGTVGFAMECFEKGLISKTETGGMDLHFGNGAALLELIHKIARREGIGTLLAEGTKRMSETIESSKHFALHIKGLELPGYDPRGMKGQGLAYALSDRGGCHVRGNMLRTELMGLPKPVDRYGYVGKAGMVKSLQLTYAACDCVIACLFGAFAITVDDYAEAVSALTGWDLSAEELIIIAERAWNLTRLFNTREGFSRKDDTLPERLFKQASTAGPSKGQMVDRAAFEKMLDEYYGLVGWDKASGIPDNRKLRELEIDDI